MHYWVKSAISSPMSLGQPETPSIHGIITDKEFILIDTAGIRRKNKVSENLEFYTVIRAIKAMDEADIIILMVDARTGLEGQDMSLYKLEKKRKRIILVVNKWDLVTKETNTMKGFEEQLRTKLAPFNDIPIIFTSVHEKQRIYNVIENIFTVYENLHKKIKTSVLNDFLKKSQTNMHHRVIEAVL